MTKEWQNELNSFNSMKGLLYATWYQQIREWKDRKVPAPLPPVEASLDPIHLCNLLCQHCNAHKYLTEPDKQQKMTTEHLHNLTRFLGEWGVLGCCFGGGGEPTLHPGLAKALDIATEVDMQSSIATNGTCFTDELIASMSRNCRWVGVSVDSATKETYKVGRKADFFDKTVNNIARLSDYCKESNSKCDVAFKFLIFDYNQHEIFEACKLAKELGAKDFHARPADYSHQGMGELANKIGGYDVEEVKKQFELCHTLEDSNFHVYTVVHKFDSSFKPRKDFSQCFASPCCIQLCADGGIYLCPDQRFQEFYKLGNHYPDPENIKKIWGNAKHYSLVFEEGKKNCSTRCTFCTYNKQCEELFIKDTDPMCKNFI